MKGGVVVTRRRSKNFRGNPERRERKLLDKSQIGRGWRGTILHLYTDNEFRELRFQLRLDL